MANTEKFSRIIEYKGTFDASAIISNFKKLENELRKRGSNEADVLNLDGEVKKVEQLNKTIQKMISKGFKTPKEFSEFARLASQMSDSMAKLSDDFKNLDASSVSNSLKTATESSKSLEAQTNRLLKDYKSLVKEVVKDTESQNRINEYARQYVNSIKEGEKVEKDIHAILNSELTLQKDKVEQLRQQHEETRKQQADLENTKKLLQDIDDFGTRRNQAFGATFLTSSNYSKKGQDLTNEDMKDVYSAISTALSSNKGDLNALINELKRYDIELKDTAKDMSLFANASKEYKNALAENKTATDKAEDAVEKAGKAYKNASDNLARFSQALGEGDKFGQGSLFSSFDMLQRSVTGFANASERAAQAKKNIETPVQGLNENIRLQNQLNTSMEQGIEATRATINEQKVLDSTFDQISNRFKYMLSFMSMWNLGLRTVRQTFEDIKGIDKAFASIAMVTDYDISGLWEQYDDYAKIANELGQSTESVIQSSALYYQQGK